MKKKIILFLIIILLVVLGRYIFLSKNETIESYLPTNSEWAYENKQLTFKINLKVDIDENMIAEYKYGEKTGKWDFVIGRGAGRWKEGVFSMDFDVDGMPAYATIWTGSVMVSADKILIKDIKNVDYSDWPETGTLPAGLENETISEKIKEIELTRVK